MDPFHTQQPPKEDYLENYKRIYSKLKKKGLLRKPNYGEAAEQLTQLYNSMKRENPLHKYAAFCQLSISRCEQALKNSVMEAAALSDAGHIFWQNEIEENGHGIVNMEEDLNEAINCYLLAIKIYRSQKKYTMAAALYYEMAGVLKKLNRNEEAQDYFHQAAELQQDDSTLCAINSLEQAVDCNIILRDYKSSCADLIWIMKLASEISLEESDPSSFFSSDDTTNNNNNNMNNTNLASSSSQLPYLNNQLATPSIQRRRENYSVYSKVMIESKITLVLLLILQGDFQQSRDFVMKLEKDAAVSGIFINSFPLITALLENLVDQCEKHDDNMVELILRELYQSLTQQQNRLILLLIEEIRSTRRMVICNNHPV